MAELEITGPTGTEGEVLEAMTTQTELNITVNGKVLQVKFTEYDLITTEAEDGEPSVPGEAVFIEEQDPAERLEPQAND